MSYAIIRNEKYTKDEMVQLAPHNEKAIVFSMSFARNCYLNMI